MTQHTFILPINGASSGIEFEEKSYKLGAGEVLVGKNNDFPEKKQLGAVLDYYDEYELETETISNLLPGQTVLLNAQWMENIVNAFDEPSNTLIDKGVKLDFDALFYLNHIYDDAKAEVFQHLSLIASINARVVLIKDGAEQKFWYRYAVLQQQGNWIKYDSESGQYSGVDSNGVLSFDGDPPPIIMAMGDPTGFAPPGYTPQLICTNNLQDYPSFLSEPKYPLSVKLKIKAREYSLNDHTYESPNK